MYVKETVLMCNRNEKKTINVTDVKISLTSVLGGLS